MPASLDHIDSDIPMGASLIGNGATFRVWASDARYVYVFGDFNNHQRDDESLLHRDELGHWRGFIPDVQDRDHHLLYVVGEGSEGSSATLMHESCKHRFLANATFGQRVSPGTRLDASPPISMIS
jgi:1,4-alpha-glucan branching enzyme